MDISEHKTLQYKILNKIRCSTSNVYTGCSRDGYECGRKNVAEEILPTAALLYSKTFHTKTDIYFYCDTQHDWTVFSNNSISNFFI